jgi:hypothetical protein
LWRSLRGATHMTDTGTTGAKTLTLPAGTVAGDLPVLLWFAAVDTAIWSTPSGWSDAVTANSQASQGQVAAAYRNSTITSGEITAGNISVTLPANFHIIAVALYTVTGFDAGTPLDISGTTVSQTSNFTNPEVLPLPASSGSTTVDGSVVISGATARAATPTWSAKPGSLTEGVAGNSADAANWWTGYVVKSPTGSFSATSVSVNSSQFHLGLTIVIRAAAASTDPGPTFFQYNTPGLFQSPGAMELVPVFVPGDAPPAVLTAPTQDATSQLVLIPPGFQSPVALAFKQPPQFIPGAIVPTAYTQSLSGSITPASVSIIVDWDITFAGSTLTPSGTLTTIQGPRQDPSTQLFLIPPGMQSPAGLAFNQPRRLLDPGIVTTSVANNQTNTGTVTSSGALAKADSITRTGSSTASAVAVKAVSIFRTGSITASGILTSLRVTLQAVAGSITSSAIVAKAVSIFRGGSSTGTGVAAKAVSITRTGSSTGSGALRKATSKNVAGAITTVGLIVRTIGKILAGYITAVGVSQNDVGDQTPTPYGTTLRHRHPAPTELKHPAPYKRRHPPIWRRRP